MALALLHSGHTAVSVMITLCAGVLCWHSTAQQTHTHKHTHTHTHPRQTTLPGWLSPCCTPPCPAQPCHLKPEGKGGKGRNWQRCAFANSTHTDSNTITYPRQTTLSGSLSPCCTADTRPCPVQLCHLQPEGRGREGAELAAMCCLCWLRCCTTSQGS
jgi:hypothetical protein